MAARSVYRQRMRAAIYEAFGDPSQVLHVGERPVPEPGPGQARVKMVRSAIHNHDLWTIRGSYGTRPTLPAIGGSEASGVVDALGEGVTNVSVGQRVTGFAAGGAWAEYFLSSGAALLPLPDAISDDLGCQLVAMPLSAMTLVETYRVEPGDWLVQNAANGAVGKALAIIAKARGIHVLHLVRSAAAVKELEDAGILGAIATDVAGWKDRAKSLVGAGKVRYGIDSIGGQASADLASVLSPGGTLVAFGSMSGEPMVVQSGDLIFRGIKAEGFWLSTHQADRADVVRRIGELVQLVASGALPLPVAGVHDLDHAAEATAASVSAGRRGKVLIRP
jgi:NADPH:quinone reductase-like Zn-dependent oxidoreductase